MMRSDPTHADTIGAFVAHTRKLLYIKKQEARGYAHRLMDTAPTARAGLVCSAIVAHSEGFISLASALFSRCDESDCIEHAEAEYLMTLLECDAEQARRVSALIIQRKLYSRAAVQALDVAQCAFRNHVDDVARAWCDPITSASVAVSAISKPGAERILRYLQAAHGAAAQAPTKAADLANRRRWQLVCWSDPCIEETDEKSAEGRSWQMGMPPSNLGGSGCAYGGLDVCAPDQPALIVGWTMDKTSNQRFQSLAYRDSCVVLSLQLPRRPDFDGATLDALRRVAPVGCADAATLLALREWGISGFVSLAPGGTRNTSIPEPQWISLQRQSQHRLRWLHSRSGDFVYSDWVALCEEAVRYASEQVGIAQPAIPDLLIPARLPGAVSVTRRRQAPTPGDEDTIEVALATDQHLAPYLPAVLESIIVNCSKPVRVHVLCRDVDSVQLVRLSELFRDVLDIKVYACESITYGSEVNLLTHTTVSTIDRLLLPRLLPDCDRVIYLDIDLIVRGDLAELWAIELRDHRLAAKSSTSAGSKYVIQMVQSALKSMPALQAADALTYCFDNCYLMERAFNAGVLVMNLDRMRREGFVEKFVPLVGRFAMNDQDILNIFAAGSRIDLDPAWNCIPRQDSLDGAKIVHFAGPAKPWGSTYITGSHFFHQFADTIQARSPER